MTTESFIPYHINTDWQYVGEANQLDSLNYLKLAKSFEPLFYSDLTELFPNEVVNERTITIEMMQSPLTTMPLVQPEIPSGDFKPADRMYRRVVSPAYFREDLFFSQYKINQLRRPGTMNEQHPAAEYIARKVQQVMQGRAETHQYLCTQCLLGGINYTDRRTQVSIDVSTNIPSRNLWRYDGWNTSLSSGGTFSYGNQAYTAVKNLTNNKGRAEAILFTSGDNLFGVPWTHDQADIVRTLRYLKTWFERTNKNYLTDMFVHPNLLTVLEENELHKAATGQLGMVNYRVDPTGVDNARRIQPVVGGASPYIKFNDMGRISSIAGLNVHAASRTFKNPETGVIEDMWPSNKVVLVARSLYNNPSQVLGYTQSCVGEAPDGRPGLYVRTWDQNPPPMTAGMSMQFGDAFLPYAMYPHWIVILDVCEASDVDQTLPMSTDLDYFLF